MDVAVLIRRLGIKSEEVAQKSKELLRTINVKFRAGTLGKVRTEATEPRLMMVCTGGYLQVSCLRGDCLQVRLTGQGLTLMVCIECASKIMTGNG